MPLYEYGATTLPSEGARRDRRSAFLVGALAGGLAGAMVMAFAWLAMGGPGSEDSSPDRDAAGSAPLTPTTLPSAGGPVNADEASTDLARCREVFDAQSAPLRAAAASLGQWEMHIGAMNKLVVGTIKLKQATQFWNQTRVGASTKLKGFFAARDPFQQRSARCPTPSSSGSVIPAERRSCYRGSRAEPDPSAGHRLPRNLAGARTPYGDASPRRDDTTGSHHTVASELAERGLSPCRSTNTARAICRRKIRKRIDARRSSWAPWPAAWQARWWWRSLGWRWAGQVPRIRRRTATLRGRPRKNPPRFPPQGGR